MEQLNIPRCLKSTSAYVNIFNNQLFFYLIKHFPLLFYDRFWIYRNYASNHFTCILLSICTRIWNTEKGMRFFFFLKRKSFHRWNCLSHLRLSESFPRFWFTRFTPFLSGKASSKQATKNWENWRGLSTHVPLGTDTNSKAKRPGSLSAAKNITPDSVCLNISSSWV